MRKATTKIDKLILLCKNVEKTSAIYTQTLGLKIVLQSKKFVELRDQSNFCLYLQESKNPSSLSKGYSPLLSFKVQNFKQVYERLLGYDFIADGEITKTGQGQVAVLQGVDGEMISINDFPQEGQSSAELQNNEASVEQIKRILKKIKM